MKTDRDLAIGRKTRSVRELRGISKSGMAWRLHIGPSTYDKVEKGETKLDVDRMQQLAGELRTTPEELFSLETIVVHVEHIHGGTNGASINAHVEQHFPEEILQRLLDRYDARHEAHIKELQQVNARQEEMNKRLLDLLEKKLG